MKLKCPAGACWVENDVTSETCSRCGTPLGSYARLSLVPSQLFNRGLQAARRGELREARDFFAAVVHWCPEDGEARNALALACYQLGDRVTAQREWQVVRSRLPEDAKALRGLEALAAAGARPAPPQGETQARRKRRRRRR